MSVNGSASLLIWCNFLLTRLMINNCFHKTIYLIHFTRAFSVLVESTNLFKYFSQACLKSFNYRNNKETQEARRTMCICIRTENIIALNIFTISCTFSPHSSSRKCTIFNILSDSGNTRRVQQRKKRGN